MMTTTKSYADLWKRQPLHLGGNGRMTEEQRHEYAKRYIDTGITRCMDYHFIPPEKVTLMTGLKYTDEQFENFYNTLPSEKVREVLAEGPYLLIAGPPQPLNTIGVCDLNLLHIRSPKQHELSSIGTEVIKERFPHTGPYSLSAKIGPLVEEKLSATWLAMRVSPVSDTLCDNQRIPSLVETLWVAAMVGEYKRLYGKGIRSPFQYLKNIYSEYTATSTLTANGKSVIVGAYCETGSYGMPCPTVTVSSSYRRQLNPEKLLRKRIFFGTCPLEM